MYLLVNLLNEIWLSLAQLGGGQDWAKWACVYVLLIPGTAAGDGDGFCITLFGDAGINKNGHRICNTVTSYQLHSPFSVFGLLGV